jgi:hypothetical protein
MRAAYRKLLANELQLARKGMEALSITRAISFDGFDLTRAS